MASIIGKLVRNQSASRIITTFNKPFPISSPPLLSRISETKHPLHRNPQTKESYPNHSLQFYPSFSFGFSLNPNPSTGFVQVEADDVVSGVLKTIWADSVKKKRKRKMNKHKLNKLRKSLRRKS